MKKIILEEAIEKLNQVLEEAVQGNLNHRYNGHQFKFEKVMYFDHAIKDFMIKRPTETLMFGHEFNKMRKEWYFIKEEKDLLEKVWGAFWWPAVERLWYLQCFQVESSDDTEKRNQICSAHYLARIEQKHEISYPGTYWLGLKTKKCFLPVEE